MNQKNSNYDVYALGNAIVDIEYRVDDAYLAEAGIEKAMMTLIDQDQQNALLDKLKQESYSSTSFAGGSAANTLALLGALGNRCFYSGCLGQDALAEVFQRDFDALGVTTRDHLYPNEDTGRCVVLITPDAERTMQTYLGVNTQFSIKDIDFTLLEQSRYLYFESYLVTQDDAFPALEEAVKFAKAKSVKVAMSFSDPAMVRFFPERLAKLMAMEPDLLFCNADEALTYTKAKDIPAALDALVQEVSHSVITNGSQGASLVYRDQHKQKQVIHVPAQSVKAVDTTGAGDSFAGAYLHGVIQNWQFNRCAAFAHSAAAQVVQQYRARLTKEGALGLLSKDES